MIWRWIDLAVDGIRSFGHLFRSLTCAQVWYCRGMRMCGKYRKKWCQWQDCPKRKGGTENDLHQ